MSSSSIVSDEFDDTLDVSSEAFNFCPFESSACGSLHVPAHILLPDSAIGSAMQSKPSTLQSPLEEHSWPFRKVVVLVGVVILSGKIWNGLENGAVGLTLVTVPSLLAVTALPVANCGVIARSNFDPEP